MIEPSAVDLSDEVFARAVPFETFARLRREAPVWWSDRHNCWIVTSHELVGGLNKQPGRFSSTGGATPEGTGEQLKNRMGPKRVVSMLAMDPPEHTRHRRAVNRSFTPPAMAKHVEDIRAISRRYIASFAEQGGGDFITEVAAPVPFRVMAQMLGIPEEDDKEVFRLTNLLMPNSDPEYGTTPETAAEAQALEAEYVDGLIEDHRQHPRNDLVGELLESTIDGQPLSQEDLREHVMLILNGGSETTRHLLAHGVLALLEWPEELQKLVSGEADLDNAVEEMLRWSTPVMHHSRWPTEEIELEGQLIQPGQRTTLWMIAANRDERVFKDPDRFDLGRPDAKKHVALGAGGPHFCLGASLARLEARIFFEEFRDCLRTATLTSEPARLQSTMFNGIKHMELTL